MCVAATGKACLSQATSYDDAEAGFSPAPLAPLLLSSLQPTQRLAARRVPCIHSQLL